MDEFSLIARYFSPLAGTGALGLKDDAALLRIPAGSELVVTTDAIVAGVHFLGYEPAHLIAQKLLRVNLSDLAAMGAKPLGYLLALSLPTHANEKWLADFAKGLKACQKTFKIALLGGDTTHTPGTLTLSATLLGTVPQGKALRRSGAKTGDDIYVSGTIGDAALGLTVARGQWSVIENADHGSRITDHLLRRYQLPEPRVVLGQKLRGLASACMDISDGLVQDLGHICAASKVGAEIHWDAIPLSSAARKVRDTDNFRETILTGGDDYELLFTAPSKAAKKLNALGATRIGRIVRGKDVRVLDENGKEITLQRKGYSHF